MLKRILLLICLSFFFFNGMRPYDYGSSKNEVQGGASIKQMEKLIISFSVTNSLLII